MRELYFPEENRVEGKDDEREDGMTETKSSFTRLEFSPQASNDPVLITLSECSSIVKVSNLS